MFNDAPRGGGREAVSSFLTADAFSLLIASIISLFTAVSGFNSFCSSWYSSKSPS